MKNIKNVLKVMISGKREGFGVILALVVSAIGLVIVAYMFTSSSLFNTVFSRTRGSYIDEITASSYIERMKGFITVTNVNRSDDSKPVLHGVQNQEEGYNTEIDSLAGLIIMGEGGSTADFNFSEDIRENGPQRVDVCVFDANYLSRTLKLDPMPPPVFSHDDLLQIPPSFFATGTGVMDWMDIGKYGSYEEAEKPFLDGLYGRFGAYLIRVKIFNTANNESRLVRTTEEAFVQLMPK